MDRSFHRAVYSTWSGDKTIPTLTNYMLCHYHPRPKRWPQVSLRGFFVLVTLSALLVPWTIAEYRRCCADAPLRAIQAGTSATPYVGFSRMVPDLFPDKRTSTDPLQALERSQLDGGFGEAINSPRRPRVPH